MEWTVVLVLVAIVGLFLSVGTPILKLNGNIVKLNANLEAQGKQIKRNEEEIREQKAHAHESHQKLWDHNAEQDKQIADHEKRIDYLERK